MFIKSTIVFPVFKFSLLNAETFLFFYFLIMNTWGETNAKSIFSSFFFIAHKNFLNCISKETYAEKQAIKSGVLTALYFHYIIISIYIDFSFQFYQQCLFKGETYCIVRIIVIFGKWIFNYHFFKNNKDISRYMFYYLTRSWGSETSIPSSQMYLRVIECSGVEGNSNSPLRFFSLESPIRYNIYSSLIW